MPSKLQIHWSFELWAVQPKCYLRTHMTYAMIAPYLFAEDNCNCSTKTKCSNYLSNHWILPCKSHIKQDTHDDLNSPCLHLSPLTELEALLDALWQTLSRAGSLSLERCLAWQLEGVGHIFVNQLVALLGQIVELFMVVDGPKVRLKSWMR